MKWLILLALVASCGKHTQPKAMDLHDSDGDQIRNYEESELDKYVANFEGLNNVSGVLRFNAEKTVELTFNNDHDLNVKTLDLMTSNEERVKLEDYFSEWSKLNVETKDLSNLKQEQYDVQIELESGSDQPDELMLVTGKTSKVLDQWSPMMKVRMSKDTLNAIVNGTSQLVLVKKFNKTKMFNIDSALSIKEKTYRVFFNDGKESKIYYVSNELGFERFLELNNIEKYSPLNEDDLFFNAHLLNDNGWFTRNLVNGDKIVMQTNMKSLRDNFLKRFTYQKKTIARVNGVSTSHLDLNNKPGAKVYLRIRSISQTKRSFISTDRRIREGGGGGGGINGNGGGGVTCHSYQRTIVKEESDKSMLEEILDQFNYPEVFDSEQNGIPSETGLFWELKAISPVPYMQLGFNNLPESTFVMTGEYRNSCNGHTRGQRTNTEGKLSLEVESYVEKIVE